MHSLFPLNDNRPLRVPVHTEKSEEYLRGLFLRMGYMDVEVYGFRFAKVKDSDEFLLMQSNGEEEEDVVKLSMYDIIILNELLSEAIKDKQ